jgi:hypothetical protein
MRLALGQPLPPPLAVTDQLSDPAAAAPQPTPAPAMNTHTDILDRI